MQVFPVYTFYDKCESPTPVSSWAVSGDSIDHINLSPIKFSKLAFSGVWGSRFGYFTYYVHPCGGRGSTLMFSREVAFIVDICQGEWICCNRLAQP